MKPTTTNCQECWLDGQREVPASWVTADGDFLCDAHLRAQGIDPMTCVPIEKWRADHGMASSERAEEKVKEGMAKVKREPKKRGPKDDGTERLPCKNPDCRSNGTYKVTQKYPFCTACQVHGFPYTKAGKAILQGEEPPALRPKFARLPPIKITRKKSNGNGHAAEPDLPITLKPDVVSIELKVPPAWLEIAWARLDCAQKARALATVLAE